MNIADPQLCHLAMLGALRLLDDNPRGFMVPVDDLGVLADAPASASMGILSALDANNMAAEYGISMIRTEGRIGALFPQVPGEFGGAIKFPAILFRRMQA